MSRLLLKGSKGKFDFSKQPDRDIKEYPSPLQDVEVTLEKDTPINSSIFFISHKSFSGPERTIYNNAHKDVIVWTERKIFSPT